MSHDGFFKRREVVKWVHLMTQPEFEADTIVEEMKNFFVELQRHSSSGEAATPELISRGRDYFAGTVMMFNWWKFKEERTRCEQIALAVKLQLQQLQGALVPLQLATPTFCEEFSSDLEVTSLTVTERCKLLTDTYAETNRAPHKRDSGRGG